MVLSSLVKGGIYLVNFNPAKNDEIGKFRPAIIISDNQDISIFATVIVIPLSTTIVKDNIPYRYLITKRDKLLKNSDACIYEIRSLAKTRVGKKLAELTSDEMSDIKNCLNQII